ncbi:MAG TPA: serine/threonine-protein kinase [Cellulomonas sp.]|uniref:serine/threonine-protein kinase n=1 Tax=Cellulomonas sp. TaxID=40001 RepID=UPI002E2EE1B0|nr:serine/threonine-protein kinase [Cellulomonas sp.]HEX5331437.1 serine/threonine-protein kinase [Cellulomonas sp.]
MTARREASAPPRIAGHRFVRVLGLGGFADVFLYEQDMPRRAVAVKVLLAGSLHGDARTRFQTEANVMARLSHHPSIVTIHQAEIADDGRPYIVMEYCSGAGLAERYRRERISVEEALRIGVRLGSAVETAHRAGVLHRDIKPANVLTTDFGWPALTDFGIATTPGSGEGAAVGMSIPWSPPELLAPHPTGDARSDVYSLAATVYSLLAGRTPFEVPGARNGAADLVGRIEREPLPVTGRGDVPPSLHAALACAMEKAPDRRYPNAAGFARALQQVEAELGLPVTPLDLNDDAQTGASHGWRAFGSVGSGTGAAVDDDATRLRPVVSIDPREPVDPPERRDLTRDEGPRLRPIVTVDPGPGEVPAPGASRAAPEVRAGTAGGAHARETRSPSISSRSRRVVAVVASALVLTVTVVALVANLRGAPEGLPTGAATSGFGAQDVGGVVAVVPAPTGLTGVRQADGSVSFTWVNPEPAAGDHYLWGVRSATGEPTLALLTEPTVTVPGGAGGQVCIEVSIVRADRSVSARPAEVCVG